MSMLPVIIQLVSGAVGGNAAAGFLKKYDLGMLWNSVVGILGGGLGGWLLGLLGIGTSTGDSLDLGSIIGSIAGGGVGGGVLLAIIGAVKKSMSK
jgi:uncharacterized membrane protein YeaQ/YmgE (transglycosylase-associated protein family)